MKKLALYAAGTAALYLLTVLTLFILSLLFKDSFDNIWVSAVLVTAAAEALLLAAYLLKKRKTRE